MLRDAEAAVVAALEVREVAGLVQDLRELRDAACEVAAPEAALRVDHARPAAALEDAPEQRRVLVLDVGEQLGAQLAVRAGEQGLGLRPEAVQTSRAAGAGDDVAVDDELARGERPELLAHGAGSDPQAVGELLGARLPGAAQRDQQRASCRGELCER